MSKRKVSNCGNCKHYNPDECHCMAFGEYEIYEGDSCENWEDGNETNGRRQSNANR